MTTYNHRMNRLAIAVFSSLLMLSSPSQADFAIQVGAFKNPDNAARAARRLESLNLGAVTVLPVQYGDSTLHAVRVGQVPEYSDAKTLQLQLRQQGWPGFIQQVVTLPPSVSQPATEDKPTTTPAAPAVSEPATTDYDMPAMTASDVYSDWSGSVSMELRYFPHDALFPNQSDNPTASVAVQPEYYREWDGGAQSLTFVPFVRWDSQDSERSHADIRELTWLKAARDWELRLGIRKVFWGVTESVHLVDVINQTDLIENIDGEEKLGQPMVNLALIRDWGTLDLFMLPGFRDRTFPGSDGRLRTQLIVDTDHPRFEADNGRGHTDWAVRWFNTLGDWDVGVAHFYGTSREPTLQAGVDGAGNPVLIPYYPLINQTSLDAQFTGGAWLWKLEWLTRDGQGDRYTAAAGGFEYTLVGIQDSAMDLGLIGEYLYDDRDEDATSLFQNDVMLGARLTFNDIQSTEVLVGVVEDLDNSQRFYNLEASRRIGDQWKLAVEARLNSGLKATDTYGGLRKDDYLQAELSWYF